MDFPIESSISNLGLAMFDDTSVVPEQVLDPRGSAMPSPVVKKIMVIFESWSWYKWRPLERPGYVGYANGDSANQCGYHGDMLVGGLEHFFHIFGTIIPTDKLIFFRGVETTNQLMIIIVLICIDHDHHDHIFINPPFEFSPLRTNQVGLFQWPQVKPKRRCFPWAF